jgi:hypothetical protein
MKKYTFKFSKSTFMKKSVYIAICILGIVIFSSCRSTANRCGLAEDQHKIQQDSIVVIKTIV